MKKIAIYALMIATSATLFLSSCGGDKEEVKPDPALNFKTTAGFTFTSTSVGVDSAVKVGVLINHSSKIKNVKFQVTILGSTFTEKDTNVNDKVIDLSFIRKVIATPGTEGWTIIATDENGKSGSVSLSITVTGTDPNLQDYSPAVGQPGVRIYNIKDPTAGNPSAFDLNTKTPQSASNTTPDNLKDILDQNASSGSYQPQWGTKTGVKYIKVTNASLTYVGATKYSQLVNYWAQNTAAVISITPVITTNDLYLVKAGDNGQYYLVSILNIVDIAGKADGDNVEFKYKTLP